MSTARLVFVYNADSGLFNTLTDIAHKAFSPRTYQCSLCAITHDLLSEKSEWKDFIASLETETEFLHRDEFVETYGDHGDGYPAVYRSHGDKLERIISAQELVAIDDVDQLKQRILDTSMNE